MLIAGHIIRRAKGASAGQTREAKRNTTVTIIQRDHIPMAAGSPIARSIATIAAWGFKRGMAGYQETDSYEYERPRELKPSTAELYRLGCFLHRLTGRLQRAGRSY